MLVPLKQTIVLCVKCGQETFESFYEQTVDNLDGWLNGQPRRLLGSK